MDSDKLPKTCQTCGLPYEVDQLTDSQMKSPDDYCRGHQSEFGETGRRDSEKPDIGQLRSCFTRKFKAEEPGVWTDFLERFGKSNGSICYYPSAGDDFRPVIYQQHAGMVKLGLVRENGEIRSPGADLFDRSHYAAPDLWLLSDYRADDLAGWLESKMIHRDERVEIRVLAHTEIHPQRMSFQQRPSTDYTSRPPTKMTGRVFYFRLALTNQTVGTIEVDVIYFCVENVNLIRTFLLRQHIPLSHLVWVQDGAGFGGGRMRHDFLIPLLTLFKTRWLFLGEGYHNSLRKVRWPRELLFHKRLLAEQVPDLQAIQSFPSGQNRVVFCTVDSTRADEAQRRERKRLGERLDAEDQAYLQPCAYLWLCCEGWMKFGPFKWLRFDEITSTISESRGEVVAWKEGTRWFVPSGSGAGMAFTENYIITTTPRHPDSSNRNLPKIKPLISPKKSRMNSSGSASCDHELIFKKEDWERYYDTEFQELLKYVSTQFQSDSNCNHCGAPPELRVKSVGIWDLCDKLPVSTLQPFRGCWYGLLLVTQGLHKHFGEAHRIWQSAVFCPLPVHPVGTDCVQVTPSRRMLQGVNFQPELWDTFISFFRDRILADVERITGVKSSSLMAAVYDDRRRQTEQLQWTESKLLKP